MIPAAMLIGVLIAGFGGAAILAPAAFFEAVRYLHTPPVIYVAGTLRVVLGIVLVGAAPQSRARTLLRSLGALIILAGLLTPLVGARVARALLEWWSAGGPWLVRAAGAVGLVIGLFILYATRPRAAIRPGGTS